MLNFVDTTLGIILQTSRAMAVELATREIPAMIKNWKGSLQCPENNSSGFFNSAAIATTAAGLSKAARASDDQVRPLETAPPTQLNSARKNWRGCLTIENFRLGRMRRVLCPRVPQSKNIRLYTPLSHLRLRHWGGYLVNLVGLGRQSLFRIRGRICTTSRRNLPYRWSR